MRVTRFFKFGPAGGIWIAARSPCLPAAPPPATPPGHPEDTMPEPAPSGAILASHSVDRPGEIDRLNAIMEHAGLGRPLGPPVRSTSAGIVLPVSADPRAVVAALGQATDHHVEMVSGYSV